MAMLHLISGLPGSGKSTLARQLEAEGKGLRFTPDEWMLALGFNLHDEVARGRVEQLQWTLAQQLLAADVSVILENGFWSKSERNAYRAVACSLGARTRLHYLAVPIEELQRRIVQRNQHMSAEAIINPDDLHAWAETFEPPTPEELEGQ